MQYALLIYETAERFANRTLDKGDAYIGAWRAYHQRRMAWVRHHDRYAAPAKIAAR